MVVAAMAVVGPWISPARAEGQRPAAWSSQSFAAAVHLVGNPVPTPFVAEVGRADLPEGNSSWSSSGQAAGMAATYYPGVGVTGGGALACSAGVPCPPGFPPDFPLIASAQYPTSPDASVATGQQLGAPGGYLTLTANHAVAHAGLDATTTEATDAGFAVAGTTQSSAAVLAFRRQAATLLSGPVAALGVKAQASDSNALRVDGLTATTSQSFDGSVLTSKATAELHGVHLLGDTILIDSILTTSIATLDGGHVAKNDSHTTLGAVSVLGQPATIDERGITIGATPVSGSDTVIATLNQAFQQALAASGAQLVLLPSDHSANSTDDAQNSQGSAGGLLYTSMIGSPSIPGPVSAVQAAIQLGQAGTIAFTSPHAAAGSTPDISLGGDITDLPTTGFPATATPVAATPSAAVATPAPRAPAAQAKPAAAPVAAPAPQPAVAVGDLVVGRVKLLYLAMTLACLGLALGARAIRPGQLRSRT
jgi:hypothetical protein